jgi:curved DNA-binding protein CbpA
MSTPEFQIFSAFSSAIKNASSGFLKVQSGNIIRQFTWLDGKCVDALTNVKEELPGYFLFHQKLMTEAQFQAYMKNCIGPKVQHWELANAEIQLNPAQIAQKKKEHLMKILLNINTKKITDVQFQPSTALKDLASITENVIIMTILASKYSMQIIQDSKPEFKEGSTKISIANEIPKGLLPEDEEGLFTVIQHNSTLHEVLDSSFLDKEKIFQWMLAFESAQHIRVESPIESDRRKFTESLNEEQKKNRNWIKKELLRVQTANFYELLNIENDSDDDEIRVGFETINNKLISGPFQNLFFSSEENLVDLYIQKIQQAQTILSNKEKRMEYDLFLEKGQGQKFSDQSQTVLEEKLLNEVNQLISNRNFDQALKFLEVNLGENPGFLKLYTTMITLVRELKLVSNEPLNQKIFDLFKRGITKDPQNFQLFLLLGEWCQFLHQKNNALKAFQKALYVNPGSKKVRDYVLQLDPEQGRQTIVEAVYQNLDRLNHFEIMGVENSSSEKEVRNSYREASKHFHPDRFFNNANESMKEVSKRVFKEMVASYQILKDAESRKLYMEQLYSSKRKKDERQKNTVPKSMQAKKYYDQAIMLLEEKNFSSAKLNIQLALNYEPDNHLLQKMLKEVQLKLSS